MQIDPLGDSALIVRFAVAVDQLETADLVLNAARTLTKAALPGVIEIAPAYVTVAVFYDPTAVVGAADEGEGAFEIQARRIAAALQAEKRARKMPKPRTVEIPVCYGGEFGPDLVDVATHAGLSPAHVIRRHAAAAYRVCYIGFTPGFGYLTGLPNELNTPRRAIPRKRVPAGAVAIGGSQTGVYPTESPGGWNVIGRTPLQLFDAHRKQPSLLAAGDAVRFRAVAPAEFASFLR